MIYRRDQYRGLQPDYIYIYIYRYSVFTDPHIQVILEKSWHRIYNSAPPTVICMCMIQASDKDLSKHLLSKQVPNVAMICRALPRSHVHKSVSRI